MTERTDDKDMANAQTPSLVQAIGNPGTRVITHIGSIHERSQFYFKTTEHKQFAKPLFL